MTLDDIFEEAKQRVLATPNDLPARSALWQVLAARGELDRAHKQLDAMVAIDSGWSMEAAACQALLRAEVERERVLSGAAAPVCLGPPPAWFDDLRGTLPLLAQASAAADALPRLARAQQADEPRSGTVNGQAFGWLCDGDARLGPCLELIVRGSYFWVPWSRISRLRSRAPTEIRDRLWLHAYVEFGDEGATEVFLPARYPGAAGDEQRLARVTEWVALGDDLYLGRGQKTLLTDSGEHGLLDIRELVFDS